MWLLFLPVVWWAGAITACAIKPDTNLLQILQVLTEKLDQPFSISYTPYTLRCVFTFTIAYVLGIGIYYSQKKNYRRGVEHGSAKWGDAASICKRYRDKRYTQNLILTQNFRMGLDCYKHKRNLNVLVVGGSGAGKSRAYAVVNIMQCNCSMVVTDPKGELLRKTGGLLEREGYEVRVFDLINPETSFCYNPFAYVRDDKDVLKLINNLIRNTTPKGAQSSDPFWEKSETALLHDVLTWFQVVSQVEFSFQFAVFTISYVASVHPKVHIGRYRAEMCENFFAFPVGRKDDFFAVRAYVVVFCRH